MTHLDKNALEAAVLAHDKEEAAMRGEPDPWADERPEDEFADRKAAMAEGIRAYLTASDAEREPVAWRWKPKDSETWIYDPKHEWLEAQSRDEIDAEPLYADPLPLTDLEAENARLKAEVERLEKADETRAQDISRLTIERNAALDRLSEALKALEPVNRFAEEFLATADAEGWRETNLVGALFSIAELRTARRVREGGKVDG